MKDDSIWGCGELVFAAPKALAVNFSSVGNNFAAVFSDATLSVDPGTGPTSLTQVLSIKVPINVPTGQLLIGYLQHLVFGVERSAGARVLVVTDLAGTLKVVEFDFRTPAGAEADPATLPPDPASLPQDHIVFGPQGMEFGLGGLISPVADYHATIMLTIQRRSIHEHVLLHLQEFDVTPILVPTASPKA
jgi:hypothetical protein